MLKTSVININTHGDISNKIFQNISRVKG